MASDRVQHGRRMKIVLVVSAPMTLEAFLVPHIRELSKTFDVDVVWNGSETRSQSLDSLPSVHFHNLRIDRAPHLARDIQALVHLRNLFARLKPDVVQSVTPKAGLLAMLAARLARVPVRVHWVTGQVWATRSGLRRYILKLVDKFMLSLTTSTLVDGPSQRAFLVNQGVIRQEKARVIGCGSIAGVDVELFRPDAQAREITRRELGITKSVFVVCFVGRLKIEKGFSDLAESFGNTRSDNNTLLLAVGRDEENLAPHVTSMLGSRFIHVEHTNQVHKYLKASDVFVLPSHREGFGLSVIEASSCELPAIVSDIYGLHDAVITGVTGLSFPVNDLVSLTSAIDELISDSTMRTRMGQAGRLRVIESFQQETIVREYVSHICELTRDLDHG